MVSSTHIRRLEKEVEQLRRMLYQAVAGNEARLNHSAVLPISQQLDAVINQYYTEKEKKHRA